MDARGIPVSLEALLLHERWVERLARALVRDGDEADDVVQEARIAFWTRPPREEAKARSWLGTVVRNRARNRARDREARRSALAREGAAPGAVPAEAPSPEAVSERLELHRRIAELVAALDEPYREALVLRYYEGLPAAEVARRLAIPAGTARWRIKIALDRLRARLDEQHGGELARWLALFGPLGGRGVETAGATFAGTHVSAVAAVAACVLAVAVGAATLLLRSRPTPAAPGGIAPAAFARAPSAGAREEAGRSARPRAGNETSALVGLVLPALAAAGRQRPLAPPATSAALSPISPERARAIAARTPPGGIEVEADDAVVEALNRLVGTAEARDRTRRALERMHAHETLVGEALEGFGLSRELAAVALLESGFDNDVVSGAAGAAGLWQLTKGAAAGHGLAVDGARDERLDPRRATEAAAALLAGLHRRFGDLGLALAAYHQGAGAVTAAIAQGGTRDARALQARGLLAPYRSGVLAAVLLLRDPTLAR
jgi:membrane-bound lytic murein transglycosylase D